MGYIRPQYLFFLSVLKISLSFPGVWVYREKDFNGFRTRDCALKIGYEDGEFHEKKGKKRLTGINRTCLYCLSLS